MAPIRWSGNTTSTLNIFSNDGASNVSDTNSVNLQANSFIVAPYIAQWSGSLGYSASGSKTSSATGTSTKSDGSSLNFGGSVSMFPVSRFPLTVSASHGTSDSRAGDNTQKTTSTVFGARQQYRTEDGKDNYNLGYNWNEFTTGNNGSRSMSLQGGHSTSREFEYEHLLWGNHSLSSNFSLSTAEGDSSGQKSQLMSANVNHGWSVHEDLNLTNTLNFTNNQIDILQGNTLSSSDTSLFLASNSFTWRPFEDMPLTLNGGANFSQSSTATGGSQAGGVRTQNDLRNIAGFLSGTYAFNSNLSASGNASLTSTSSGTGSSVSSSQGASLSYSGDPLSFGNYMYGWGVGGGVSNSTSSAGGGSFGTSLSASHNLTRTIVVNEENVLNLNASQGLALNQAPSSSSVGLTNMLGAAWRASYGPDLTGNLSANYSNNISTGDGGGNQFHSVSLLGSGVYQYTSRAAISLNANLTWTQSKTENNTIQALNGVIVDTSSSQISGSFGAGYSHRSPFSIPFLNYNASLLYVNSQSNQALVGSSPQSNSSQASISFQQFVDYRIGRLVFSVSTSIIDQGGRKSASLLGSVTREFDGFFDGRW